MNDYPSITAIMGKARHEIAEANLLAITGHVVTVVPGFEWLQIENEIVGRRLTMKDVCGDDSNEFAAVEIYDSPIPSHKTIVFRTKELKQRHVVFVSDRRKRTNAFRESPEKEVEDHIAEHLRSIGHVVEQQVRCGSGIVDIVDRTDNVLIECKAHVGGPFIMSAVSQLERYARFFPGCKLAVGLPSRPDDTIARGLTAIGVEIITQDEASPLISASPKSPQENIESTLADLMASYIAPEHWPSIQAMLPVIKPSKLAAEFEKHIAKLGAAA